MNYPELIAVVFGIASVWFARKENILVFPMGIISVLIFIYIFFTGRMYANAGINLIYFFTNAFGWYNWSRKKKRRTCGKNHQKHFPAKLAHHRVCHCILHRSFAVTSLVQPCRRCLSSFFHALDGCPEQFAFPLRYHSDDDKKTRKLAFLDCRECGLNTHFSHSGILFYKFSVRCFSGVGPFGIEFVEKKGKDP